MIKIFDFFDIRTSIKKKMIIAYILVLLPALIIPAALYYVKLCTAVETVLTNDMFKMTELVNANIETYIHDAEKITSAPYYSNEMQDILQNLKYKIGINRAEAEDKLFNTVDVLMGIRKDIVGIYIFDDTNNKYYKTSVGDITPFYYFVEQPWYSKVKKLNGERLVIPTHKADYFISQYPKYVFSVASSIQSKKSNEQIGVICVDMNLEVIKNILTKFDETNTNEFYIIDEDKSLIYKRDEANLGEVFNEKWVPDIDSITSQKGQIVKKIDGKRKLITYYHSQSIKWWYITVSDLDALVLPNLNVFRSAIIILTVSMLIILFIVSVFVSNMITRPIKKLQKAMKHTGEDSFKIVESVPGKDEIGMLIETYNTMVNKISDLINTVYKVTIKEKEAQLNVLQTQINPHFLYNTLNSIGCIAQVKGVNEIPIVCKSLADIFRYNIKAGGQLVPISDEMKCIKDYMTIQKIRYGDRIEVDYCINESIMNYRILKLTLQPIIENAIYHGLEPKRGIGRLDISIEEVDNYVIITIKDNGIGMSDEKLNAIKEVLNNDDTNIMNDKAGVGFKNVHDRISLYFGKQYGLKINSELGNGTIVKMYLPLLKE